MHHLDHKEIQSVRYAVQLPPIHDSIVLLNVHIHQYDLIKSDAAPQISNGYDKTLQYDHK